ncbi:MAG: Smr/MutS family protein [Dehalococcoidia bacterium]|nr:Smr/MutS family protein [Dehalococcoidia bacterium]
MKHKPGIDYQGRIDPAGKAGVNSELDLHALTVDEALPIIHGYLNDACLAGLKEVRIVHGKGTGALRQVVMRELKRHPLVKSFRTGNRFEGSTGATIVEL